MTIAVLGGTGREGSGLALRLGLAGFPVIGGFLQNLAQDSSVFGKILVLALIVLFLQWRPAGLFVTRSRSLD